MEWLSVLLIILGLLLLFIEVFLAGFGVAGTSGIILLIWGGVLIFTDIEASLQAIVIGLLVTIAVFALLMFIFSRLKFWKKMTLTDRQENAEGYAAPILGDFLRVGLEGRALTPLRPAGTAEFEHYRVDVVTEGDFIAQGEKVRVLKLEGVRVVVEKAV